MVVRSSCCKAIGLGKAFRACEFPFPDLIYLEFAVKKVVLKKNSEY